MEELFHKNLGKITFIVCLPLILAFAAQKIYAYDENGDRFCIAQNIYFEAANQSFAGKLAVANVVMNRTKDTQFPSLPCDVVYQAYMETDWKGDYRPIKHKCQFSWYCDGKSDTPTDSDTWMNALYIADLALSGLYPDITEGSLWYHADFVLPYWSEHLELVTTIDNHLFYK